MAQSYRTSFIETSGGESLNAHKLFCSWDYGISNKKAAQMKQRSIFNGLQMILDELYDTEEEPSFWNNFWTSVTQMAAHMFVFGILAGLGYAIWKFLQVPH